MGFIHKIYAELTQNSIDKHLKKWNEKWFPKNIGGLESTEPHEKTIPDFLSIRRKDLNGYLRIFKVNAFIIKPYESLLR